MKEYKLHSHGKNWFHFRADLTHTMESFSITYLHDGTVVMHGDYGTLAWQRDWFPEHLDYGFPHKGTYIGYFAEKIVRAEDSQHIREWTQDNAIRDLKEAILQYIDDGDEFDDCYHAYVEMLAKMEDVEYSEHEFVEEFMEHDIDSEDWSDMGIDYTEIFRHKFECLISVYDVIMECVKKNTVDHAQAPLAKAAVHELVATKRTPRLHQIN